MREKVTHKRAAFSPVKAAGILIILAGLLVFFYPDIKSLYTDRMTESYVEKFHNELLEEKEAAELKQDKEDTEAEMPKKEGKEDGTGSQIVFLPKEGDPLYEEIKSYNTMLYESNQQGFSDAWTITQVPVELKNLKDDSFGYLEIPAMDVTLPLYIGASSTNMAKGAAILGQTSIPIGGTNTNSVIAGHRGYKGIPFFREIEKLKIGDEIFITSRWDKLCYRVSEIMIIDPYDSEKLSIREGEDMISLVTCHPYRSHGKKRYIVFAVRDKEYIMSDPDSSDETVETIRNPASSENSESFQNPDAPLVVEDSSEEDIKTEDTLRRAGGIMILVLLILTFIRERRG